MKIYAYYFNIGEQLSQARFYYNKTTKKMEVFDLVSNSKVNVSLSSDWFEDERDFSASNDGTVRCYYGYGDYVEISHDEAIRIWGEKAKTSIEMQTQQQAETPMLNQSTSVEIESKMVYKISSAFYNNPTLNEHDDYAKPGAGETSAVTTLTITKWSNGKIEVEKKWHSKPTGLTALKNQFEIWANSLEYAPDWVLNFYANA